MSEESFSDDMYQDTRDFLNTFCDFHRAFPNEPQHIIDQVYEQIMKAERSGKDYIQGDRGQEEIWVFERSGTTVYKRVFHPSPGEAPVGVDFALYKKTKQSRIGATAVQVKRNRKQNFFEFRQRDLDQLNRLAENWGSAYYLMVDETVGPPLYCFLTVGEVYDLIQLAGGTAPAKILNRDVRRHCRGLDNFYDLFYTCNRGSSILPEDYSGKLMRYIRETRRVVVELSAKRSTQKSNTPKKPEDHEGRLKGFLNSV